MSSDPRNVPRDDFTDDGGTIEWRREEDTTLPAGPADEAAVEASSSPDLFLGRFELVRLLGRGALGEVHLAVHVKLQKPVALKLLSPERITAPAALPHYLHEIRQISQSAHPNIVRFESAGEAEGVHYLVLEYVPGLNFARLVQQAGPLPVADACQLIGQAAVGLEFAHALGLVHRDVRPAHLMLATSKAVKILDFGQGVLIEEGNQGPSAEGYRAPELNDTPGDTRADIYGLGRTLQTLLTGGPPPDFPPLPPDVPEALAGVIGHMTARDPARRYPTPGAVARALAPFAEGCDLTALLGRVGLTAVPTEAAGSTPVDSVAYLTARPMSEASAEPRGPSAPASPVPPKGPGRRATRVAFLAAAVLGLLLAVGGVLYWGGLFPLPDPDPLPDGGEPPGRTVVLDWDQVEWPNPQVLSRTFSFDDVDVTISLEGDLQFNGRLDTPNDNRLLLGGKVPTNLLLGLDWDDPRKSLTTTITFSAPVKDVSFYLAGIDREGAAAGSPTDQVTVRGHDGDRPIIPDLEPGAAVEADRSTGTVTGTRPSGADERSALASRVKVSFPDSLRRVTLHYTNAPKATRPGPQAIGLHDIRFTADKPFAASYKLDWEAVDWREMRTHTVRVADTDVTFTLSGDRARSAARGAELRKGPTPDGESSLRWTVVRASPHETVRTAIDFSRPVDQLRFGLLDVGAADGQAEQVQVQGLHSGRPVTPTIERTAGDGEQGPDGTLTGSLSGRPANATVRFGEPVDRVLLVFKAHQPGRSAEEGQPQPSKEWVQQVALHDLHFQPARWDREGGPETGPLRLIVPATADPFLAGATTTTGDRGKSRVPGEAPVWVRGLPSEPGGALSFTAKGLIRHSSTLLPCDPDGGPVTQVSPKVRAGLTAGPLPVGSLVGVFLGDVAPATTPPETAPVADDGTYQPVSAPRLHEVFFIGDGRTPDGRPQQVLVPAGARRLYLGVIDSGIWHDNVGRFDVEIVSHPPGGAVLELVADADGAKVRLDRERQLELKKGVPLRVTLPPGRHVVDHAWLGYSFPYELVLAPRATATLPIPPRPVDLLAALDPQRDAIDAEVTRDEAGLVLGGTAREGAWLQFPLLPPRDYALRLKVERLDEKAADLSLGLPIGPGRAAVSCSDAGGIVLAHVPKDSQVILGKADDQRLSPRQPAELTMVVRREGVSVLRDGRPVIDWRGDPAALRLARQDAYHPGLLFLRCQGGPLRLHSVELIPLSGPPRPVELSPATASADRLAAERAIWKGGQVRLWVEGRASPYVTSLDGLPEGMRLYGIYDADSRGLAFDDRDLALVGLVKHLRALDLQRSRITDVGLAHLADLKELHWLILSHTNISNAGMAHLGGLTEVDTLFLVGTPVGDAGLARLRGWRKLRQVGLSSTRVGDEGIAALAPALSGATWLCVCGAPVTGKSLVHLGQLKKLQTLHLGGASVKDEDLAHLHGLKGLKEIRLVGTKVTEEGKQQLAEYLPGIRFLK